MASRKHSFMKTKGSFRQAGLIGQLEDSVLLAQEIQHIKQSFRRNTLGGIG